MKIIKSIDNAVDKFIEYTGWLTALLLVLVALFIFIEIMARIVLRFSFFYFFELSIFATIILAFLGSAYCLKVGHHISVDILTSRFSAKTKAMLNIINAIIPISYFTVLAWKGWDWIYICLSQNVMEPTVIPLPRAVLVAAIPVGAILLIIQSIRLIIRNAHIIHRDDVDSKPVSKRFWDSPLTALFILIALYGISALLLFKVNIFIGLVFLLLVFLFSGMPVSFALGSVALFGLLIFFQGNTTKLVQIPIAAFAQMNSFNITALPLFILGGVIMARSNIAGGVFTLMERWLWRFPPSLMLAAIGASGVFCAITGSSVGATATMSKVCLPELFKRGYNRSFACGVVAGATVGSLIPPSLGLIAYGILTETSISQLFMSALVPGVILFTMYSIFVVLRMYFMKEKVVLPSKVSWSDRFSSLKDGFWGILTPIIILGGIYVGWFTPTEVAAVLVVYGLVVSFVIVRTLKLKDLREVLLDAVHTSLMILFIIIGAIVFGILISQGGIDRAVVEFAKTAGLTTGSVLVLFFVTLTVFGFFLDGASILLITLPVFYPLAMGLGIDPYWLAIFYIINLEVGLITPPVGLNLFVIRDISGEPFGSIIRGTFPFMLMLVSLLLIIYFFPQLVSWLPSTM
ncbi:TRAP transporter large permease subunit [Chloroflexota bacterium]